MQSPSAEAFPKSDLVSIHLETLGVIFTTDHRKTEVIRNLWSSPGPTPCSGRASHSCLPRAMTCQLWNISKDANSKTSLGNLWQCSVTWKKTPNKQNPNQTTIKEPVYVLVCAHCLWSCGWALWKKAWLHLIYLLTSDNSIPCKIPWRSPKSYSTLSFSSQQKCSSPFIRVSPAHPCLSFTVLPALKTMLQVWSHQC